ncbi:SDR family oxidoreductase [Spongiibacter sp. KMU-158]|uniref:SDR family oxidoreductase n=1 Tax=Spongiibacter pelagi TaxID=2760804 RepID=A0A927C0G4_9GAMM|nr:SDR family oxidoreductase [Spongiibacter pelagi]MBD2857526.1 SDR family oxidoreductase [Spongiibacter pelagi]
MKAEQNRILIIACGDIGGGVAEHFLAQGWAVSAMRRNISQLPDGVEGIAADLTDAQSMAQCPPLAADYVLFTLTPARGDGGYEAVFQQGLERVLAKLSRAPKRIFFVSSTGVYDQVDHEWIDESSATEPSRASGQSILKAEQRIAEAAQEQGCNYSLIRFGGIYGPGREHMLNKIRTGECAPQEPLHYTNRIHRDDCVGFLSYLIEQDAQGAVLENCYIGVDTEPASIQEVQSWVAEFIGVPYRCNGEAVQRTGSKRCRNQRLLASGYRLLYPNYRAGFTQILAAPAQEKPEITG